MNAGVLSIFSRKLLFDLEVDSVRVHLVYGSGLAENLRGVLQRGCVEDCLGHAGSATAVGSVNLKDAPDPELLIAHRRPP